MLFLNKIFELPTIRTVRLFHNAIKIIIIIITISFQD